MWLKAWHLIFMVTWFAGLFYLPRLFVYHAMSEDRTSIDRFIVMERKLYYGITTPGMILTLIFGIWMLFDYAWAAYSVTLWLQIKLGLLGAMLVYHLYCGKLLRDLKSGRGQHSHVWYRWFNEIPVFFLIAITLLAVLKPW